MPKVPPLITVLAGGSGTRFWPAGRVSRPKQVLALDGDDPRHLLDLTLRRLRPLSRTSPPVLIAPDSMRALFRKSLPDHPSEASLWEPRPRNTAPAVALAAFAGYHRDPQTPVLVVPADHHVQPLDGYRKALRAMLDRARDTDAILTLGLQPDRPATGYGYLRVGKPIASTPGGPLHVVNRFVEKPALAKARRMTRDGNHMWNGGTFAFRADAFLDAVEAHLPEVFHALREAFRGVAAGRLPSKARLTRAYAKLPSISVDYGIMERVARVETIRATLDWDDLGSWDAVARHRKPDAEGNCPRGDVTLIDAKDCVVDAQEGHIALLGVDNLIVVRTGDTVLVAKRGRGEDVRQIVDALKRTKRADLL